MLDIIKNNQILLIFSVFLLFLITWNIFLHLRISQIKKRLKSFFNGSKAKDLEGVLFEEIKRMKKAENNIQQLFETTKILEKVTEESLQKVSVVRFNPFKDTGGDQSFAIALLDAKDSGLVISSLFTRQGTRIYSKPIKNGQSEYPLSKEETEALKKAGVKVKE